MSEVFVLFFSFLSPAMAHRLTAKLVTLLFLGALLFCCATVAGAPALAPSPSPPSFPPAYRATFSRYTTFTLGDNSTQTDGVIFQSNVFQATKVVGRQDYFDQTILMLYAKNETYAWLTWWGFCGSSRGPLAYFDVLQDAIKGASFAGLVRMPDGRTAQLWEYRSPSFSDWVRRVWVTNDTRQEPLRACSYWARDRTGYDVEFTGVSAGGSPDDFKPAGSCSVPSAVVVPRGSGHHGFDSNEVEPKEMQAGRRASEAITEASSLARKLRKN